MSIEGFRYQTPVTVRYEDLDAQGHLNNLKYQAYMEHGRICYVRDVCGWDGNDWHTLGMILAKVSIEYLAPVYFGDELSVFTRISRLGTKSFDIDYRLVRHNDETTEVVAESTTVMVAYDYQSQQTIPILNEWRERVTAYEPIFQT